MLPTEPKKTLFKACVVCTQFHANIRRHVKDKHDGLKCKCAKPETRTRSIGGGLWEFFCGECGGDAPPPPSVEECHNV